MHRMREAAEATPALSVATLFGVEVAFETADELREAGRLWPVTHELARVLAAEYPPPHGLRGKRVVELGAGTAVLSVAIATAYDGVAEVVATDLPSVVPLLCRNVARVPASRNARAAELSWGCELDAALARPDVVLCCELAYWGGWSLLRDDTRLPLRQTLRALGGTVFFACTLRDADRELGFVRALQADDRWVCRCAFAPVGSQLRLTLPATSVAPGSAALESAKEGDVLLLVLTRPEHACQLPRA